jgi:hypothetical protein
MKNSLELALRAYKLDIAYLKFGKNIETRKI